MKKYAEIVDKETGLCNVGIGEDIEFYISIGMKLLDVTQSEVDDNWYLTSKCPHYTEQEKFEMAKDDKYTEALNKANEFISMQAVYRVDKNNTIEATDGNIGKLTAYALGFTTGLYENVQWTTKEDNVIILNQEELLQVLTGLGAVQSDVWNVQYVNYKQAIDNAKTIEEVNAIEVNYD